VREIDCAVRGLVGSAFDRATGIVRANRALMEEWVLRLPEKETLGEEELKLMAGPITREA